MTDENIKHYKIMLPMFLEIFTKRKQEQAQQNKEFALMTTRLAKDPEKLKTYYLQENFLKNLIQEILQHVTDFNYHINYCPNATFSPDGKDAIFSNAEKDICLAIYNQDKVVTITELYEEITQQPEQKEAPDTPLTC